MVMAEDAVELLLPHADAELARRARDTIRFLRLLTADARSEPAGRVGVDLERARGDLELGSQRQVRSALVELLRAHLAHACGPDSFAWFGPPRADLSSVWSQIEEARAEFPWLPEVPAPGEAAGSVAARVLEGCRRLEPGSWEWELWNARLARVELGARAGEEAFRRGLDQCSDADASTAQRAAWLAGCCECQLDRGAVREARALLLEHRERVLADARLCQLLGWSKLLLGDIGGARALLAGRRAPEVPLPGPLHELRASQPEWTALLPQRFTETTEEASLRGVTTPRRAQLGASVCIAFALEADQSCRARLSETSPGLCAARNDWLEVHGHALQEEGTPEQAMLLDNQVVVRHRTDEHPLAGTLGAEQTLAVALVPIVANHGGLLGWVHLEFEHHLVPRPRCLQRWAREIWPHEAQAVARLPAPSPSLEGAGALDFAGLVEELGLRSAQRHWWGFVVRDGGPWLAAEGGELLASGASRHQGRGLLQRVLLAGGHVHVDEPDVALTLHPSSQSGLALALRWGERTSGVLVVESIRRHDFRRSDTPSFAGRLRTAALRLDVGHFVQEHRERHGSELWFDVGSPDFQAFAERLQRAAASACAVLISGPPGSGKTVLAQWLHHLSPRREAPLIVCGAARLGNADSWNRAVQQAAAGSLLIEDIDRLDPAAQLRLLEWLEAANSPDVQVVPPRLIATVSDAMQACVQPGRLCAALAGELQHVWFTIPPLAARRHEVLPLAEGFLARFARLEGRRKPEFDDAALGMLWRQPWEGNLRELAAVVHRVVLFGSGARLSAEELERLSARCGQRLARRIPSRHPLKSDLASALRSTRLGTGRVNKTRAAAYLGWDPDTLVARMTSLGIDGSGLESAGAWSPALDLPRSGNCEDDPIGCDTGAS